MDPRWIRTARPVAELRRGRTDWYRIENKSTTNTDVYIYDEIGYWGVTAKDFVIDLNKIDAKNITIHLNSPGGDVFDGLAIYNAVKQHPSKTKCIVEGLAASAASFIAMAGDEVVIARNAQMMIHDASGICIGNSSDMRELADLLDQSSDNIADIYMQKAGGDVADWRAKMKAETWFSAQDAVDCGLADSIQEDGEPVTNTWDLSIFAKVPNQNTHTDPAPVQTTDSGKQDQAEDANYASTASAVREALKEAFR